MTKPQKAQQVEGIEIAQPHEGRGKCLQFVFAVSTLFIAVGCGDEPVSGTVSERLERVRAEANTLQGCIPSVSIAQPSDLTRLHGVECIDGDLEIGVESVDGTVRRENAALTLTGQHAFEDLKWVTGEIVVMDTAFSEEVVFPRLKTAGRIRYCIGRSKRRCLPKLPMPRFSFPRLTTAEVSMVAIEKLSVPKLQTAKSISLNKIQGDYAFPSLSAAGAIKMRGESFSVAFPQLGSVDGEIDLASYHAEKSSRFSLPRLRHAQTVKVTFGPPDCDDNDALLPRLEDVDGDLSIRLHPKTDGCSIKLPKLQRTENMTIAVSSKRRGWSFKSPRLKKAHKLSIEGSITELQAPLLEKVNTLFTKSVALESLDLPRLHTATNFMVTFVDNLKVLRAPRLKIVKEFLLGNRASAVRRPNEQYSPPPEIELGIERIQKRGIINDVPRLRDWPLPALKGAEKLEITRNPNMASWTAAQLEVIARDFRTCGNKGETPCSWERPLGEDAFARERPFPSQKDRRRFKFSRTLTRLAEENGGAHVDAEAISRVAGVSLVAVLSNASSGELEQILAIGPKGLMFDARPTQKTREWSLHSNGRLLYVVALVPPSGPGQRSYEVFQLRPNAFRRLPEIELGPIAKDRTLIGLGPSRIGVTEEYRDREGNAFAGTEYQELHTRIGPQRILRVVFLPPRLKKRGKDNRLPIVVRLIDDAWVADESLATTFSKDEPFRVSGEARRAATFAAANHVQPPKAEELPDPKYRIENCLSAVPQLKCRSPRKRAQNSPVTTAYCLDRKRKIDGKYIEWYPSTCAGTGRPSAASIKGLQNQYKRIDREGAVAVRMQTTYAHGIEIGPRLRYTPNGTLLSVSRMNSKGERHGWSEDYQTNRTKNEGIGLFFEGRKIGRWRYPRGVLRDFGFASDGEEPRMFRE